MKTNHQSLKVMFRGTVALLFAIFCSFNTFGQNLRWYNGKPGNPVGFEIDGNFFRDTVGNQDWSGASGIGVLKQSGGATVPGLNIINADEVANWVVDQNWGCSGCKDSSQFDGTSNKNGDNIAPGTLNWTYSINGQGPQKNDLTNLMMFLKRSGGETWLIGGAETRASNGDAHIDFEYNQAGVYTQGSPTNGYIKGNGPVGGRTVGDFIVCIDYENGGANPIFTLRVWNLPGQFDLVSLVPQRDYFFAANITNVPAVAPGRGVSTGGNATNTTTTLQFVEFALKSSVINALFNSPAACNTNATLNYKTRSSQSFTAELKDFRIMPVVITLPPDITCGPDQCTCQNTAGNTFNLAPTACDAAYSYTWTKVSSTGTLAVNIVNPSSCSTAVNTTGYGTAVIKVKATKGACSDSCTTQIIVRPTPVCSITVPGGPVCPNTVTTHSAPAGYDKYTWTVTGNASIVGSNTGQSVQVQAGAVCGSYTVNLEAGNNGCTTGTYCTSTCSQTVQVQDNNSPSISTLTNKTIACTDPIVWNTPTASDNCDPNPQLTFADQTVSGNAICRLLRRTWTAMDACGNTSTRTQDINIVDNTAPSPSSLPTKTANCNSTLVWDTPTATDNCDPNPTITYTDQFIGTNPYCRTARRIYTVADLCGNTATTTQDINIVDNIAPTISSLTNKNISCTDPIVWDTPTASDNCDPNPSLNFTSSTVSGNSICRTLRRTWTAADGCGNTATITQDITITDNVPPVLGTLPTKRVSCGSTLIWDTPNVTDNCDPVVIPTLLTTQFIGSNPYCRTARRIWLAIDICGNSDTTTQDIIIEDLTDPTLSVGRDTTINCNYTPVWGTPTATDNCASINDIVITYNGETRTNGSCPQNYTLTRSWTATDLCGRSDTKTQSITFQDTQAPSITCPADKTLACGATATFDPPSANDNCSTYTINTLGTDTTYNSNGSVTFRRRYNAVDACGNTSTECSQSVTVPACSRFCTYTQGAYGNAGGTHCNGQTTPAFVTGLLSTPLTVGAGTKTITFTSADASCLISKLPAGGTAAVLGGSYTCATIQPINSGKIYNVLLGQNITLGLNMRINGGTLSSLRLTGRFIRTASGTGTGCSALGTATGSGQAWALPQSVITYLGANNTVADLFALANRALGGTYVPSGSNPSLSDINNAVDVINNAFDGCKVLVSISNTAPRISNHSVEENVVEGLNVLVYPNPFSDNLRVRVEAPSHSHVSVEIYSMDGRKVADVFNGLTGEETIREFDANTSMLSPGTYLCRVVAGGQVHIERVSMIR